MADSEFPPSSQLTPSQWVARSRRPRSPDGDRIIWQASQSACDPLNKLISLEASQTRRLPSVPVLPGFSESSFLPRDLSKEASTSTIESSIGPSRNKRARPSKAPRHHNKEEEDLSQGGDPSDFYAALRGVMEYTSAKAQRRASTSRTQERAVPVASRPPPQRVHSEGTVVGSDRSGNARRGRSPPRTSAVSGASKATTVDNRHMVVDVDKQASGRGASTNRSRPPSASPCPTTAPSSISPQPVATVRASSSSSAPALPTRPPIENRNPIEPKTRVSGSPLSSTNQPSPQPTQPKAPQAPRASQRPPALGMRPRGYNIGAKSHSASVSPELPTKRKGFKSPLINASQAPRKNTPEPLQKPLLEANQGDAAPPSPPAGVDSSFDFDSSWDMELLHESLKQYDA